jgi:ankyrin repeat protein
VACRDTALIFAAANGHTPAVELLIAAGADLNAKDTEGCDRFCT